MATTKYVIHKIGTPKLACPNTERYWDSEWWSNEYGWAFKSDATVYEDTNWNLPLDGEWVEIYVNEPVLQDLDNQ